MKYKVGYKVKIHGVADHRKRYNGKVVTIMSVNPNSNFNLAPHYGVGECFIFYENELVPVFDKKIVITTDGTETLARLYDGGKVIKTATAKCSPDDTFDFNTGAKLAFERLIGEEKKKKQKPFKFEVGKQYKHKGRVIEITNARHEADGNHYDFKVIRGKIGGSLSFAENNPWQDGLVLCEWYNGKVVCVKSDKDFTVGKVYEFIDGQVKDNDETARPVGRKIVKLEDYCGALYKFIPLVE